MTQQTHTWIYILLGAIILLLGVSLWQSNQNAVEMKETYAKKDSVIQNSIDTLLKHIADIDTTIQANNRLIANNEFAINNYYISNEKKKKQIIENPLDSARIVNVKNFLDSVYRANRKPK